MKFLLNKKIILSAIFIYVFFSFLSTTQNALAQVTVPPEPIIAPIPVTSTPIPTYLQAPPAYNTGTPPNTDSDTDTSPNPANMTSIIDSVWGWTDVLNPLRAVAKFINLLNSLLGWLIASVGEGINFIVRSTNVANNPGIIIGWTILRDFANMFFIFVMLIMSIATILRFEEYGVKRLLTKIIIAAFLINFSRLFAFGIIDLSHVFVNVLLQAMSSNNKIAISEALSQGMGLNKLYNPTTAATEGGVILSLLFIFIVQVVVLFSFLAAWFLFVVRIIYLSFLVLVSPMAFLGYMAPFPIIRNWWGDWWKNLFKWSFFAPIYLFFVYITIIMIKSGVINGVANQNNFNLANYGGAVVSIQQPDVFLNMLIVVGFLIGGLLMATSMAGKFGGMALAAGSAAGGFIGGYAAAGGRKITAKAGRTIQKSYDEGGMMSKGPGRYLALASARVTAGSQAREMQEVENRKSQLKNQYGDNATALHARLLTSIRPNEKAAIVQRLSEIKGGMKSDNSTIQNKINSAAVSAARLGFQIKSRPDLAAEGKPTTVAAAEAIDKAIKRITPKDAENLSADSITARSQNNPNGVDPARVEQVMHSIFRNMGPSVLAKITTENEEFAKQLSENMRNMGNMLGKTYTQFVDEIERTYGNAGLANGLKANPALKTRYEY